MEFEYLIEYLVVVDNRLLLLVLNNRRLRGFQDTAHQTSVSAPIILMTDDYARDDHLR